jgi:phage terminase Nu1 subunit (DNA packaging protein)
MMTDDADPIVTRAELARRLGLSTRTIGDHAAHGRLVRSDGGYLLWASIRALVTYQAEALAGRNTEVNQARARLELAKAKMAELKLAEAEGRSLDAEEVLQAWIGLITRVRNRILQAPKRLQITLGHLTRSDFAAIERELRDALTELGTGNVEEEEAARPSPASAE